MPLHPCEAVIGAVRPWLGQILNECYISGISKKYLVTREIDHMCFRCRSTDEYVDVRTRLTSNDIGTLLVEDIIGGRPISTILLSKPYVYEDWTIPCIEIACPKKGKAHKAGLEHVEVVIGDIEDGFHNSKEKLLKFIETYPNILFDMKAIDKAINADISLVLADSGSMKFHVRSLFDVCTYELSQGITTGVPPNYFDDAKLKPDKNEIDQA